MGIVAYFARVRVDQLERLKGEPEKFWSIPDSPNFSGAELTDLDRDWEILSWLLSPKKREEQKHQTVTVAVMHRNNAREIMEDDVAWAAAMKEEQTRLGIELSEPDDLPSDAVLVAIEGRGSEEQRVQEINFGLGGARLFSTDEVHSLARELAKIGPEDLRANFVPEVMEKVDVGGIGWLTEPPSVLEEFIVPRLERLKEFYKNAAGANQCVLVVYA